MKKTKFTSEKLNVRENPYKKNTFWKKIGMIGVDSGSIWIGDPVYFIGDTKEIAKSWEEFLPKIGRGDILHKEFSHLNGVRGLGVYSRTAYGDGEYPVLAKIDSKTGRTLQIKINFVD